MADQKRVWLNVFESVTVTLLALLVTALHVRFVTNVGGLWRDEANSVNLATLPSFAEMWRVLDYDSFPILFFAVLRGWTAIFGANDDLALRVLGLITGLGILGALVGKRPILRHQVAGAFPRAHRIESDAHPLWRFDPRLRTWDPSHSSHVTKLLASGRFARTAYDASHYRGNPPRPAQRPVPLLQLGPLVGDRRRGYGRGDPSARLANLGHCSRHRHAGGRFVATLHPDDAPDARVDLPREVSRRRFCLAVGARLRGAWLTQSARHLVVASVGNRWPRYCGRRLGKGRRRPETFPGRIPTAALFAAVTLAVGVASYAGFLRVLNYWTQPWYYITLAAFVACLLEVLFGAWPATSKSKVALRVVRLPVALLLLCVAVRPAWKELPTRHTDVDLIAGRLHQLATKDDLIVVPPWQVRHFALSLLPRPSRSNNPPSDQRTPLPSLRPCSSSDDDGGSAKSRSGAHGKCAADWPSDLHRWRLSRFLNRTSSADSSPAFQDASGDWHGGYRAPWRKASAITIPGLGTSRRDTSCVAMRPRD